MDFALAGVAAVMATALTNPIEVIKTRQQIQGEMLPPHLMTGKQPYTGIWPALRTIVKSDGLLGLQKGLSSSLVYTFIINSARFGLFEWADKLGLLRDPETGTLHTGRSALASSFGGIVGLTLACPMLQVKTQLQIDSSHLKAVGFQHKHKNARSAVMKQFREHGMRGLWRGYWGVLPRGIVSSGVQLTTFSMFKEYFGQQQNLDTNLKVVIASSTMSSIVLVLALTPFDVINTRVFNQALDANGHGMLYRNPLDCLLKTVKIEGSRALYKGLVANALLVCPHTIMQMIFWEQLKEWFGTAMRSDI